MIRAVLFDLDGTLYDRDVLVRQIAEEQYGVFRRHLQDIDERRFVDRVIELDDHGYGSKPELYARIALDHCLDSDVARQLEGHFWEAYDRYCRPSEDTLTTLATLQDVGMKMGVITNGSVKRQDAKLRALGLSKFFDVVLISEAEGLRKPDPQIFRRAVERSGVSPSEAMFVGDHPEVDVAGARTAGLTPVWKRVPYWHLALDDVLVIDRLGDLLPACAIQNARVATEADRSAASP